MGAAKVIILCGTGKLFAFFFSSCSDFGIFRHQNLVLNTLMRALGVVVFNVVLDAFTQFLDIIRGIDIYILALDCSPEPFYPNVI